MGVGEMTPPSAAGALSSAPSAEVALLAAKVAATCRLLNMEGILNYSGHVSARLPGQDAFLIHPFISSRASVGAGDIVALDLDLRPLPGSPAHKPPIETPIHSEIYRARPDVQAVVHTHSELAAAFTVADAKLLPMKSHAARWSSGIPVHPDPSRIEAILIDAVHFEENARAQVQALAIGPLLPLTEQELALLERRSNRAQHVD